MKKILNTAVGHLLFLSLMIIVITLASCSNEDSGASPVITEVRNYAAAPNDTIVDKLVPGQWVVLKGSYLKNTVKISFNGVAADFDSGLFSDTYAVVQIPAVIPFPSVAENELNTIEVVNSNGSTVFEIAIVAGPPSLTGISNENPIAGEEVTIQGTNLFLIKELYFAGTQITAYTGSDDGTAINFLMPAVTTTGPLKINTASGVILTPFEVNNTSAGVISNADAIFNWDYWGGAQVVKGEGNPDFPGGNASNFFVMNFASVSAGDGQPWSHALRIGQTQWVPSGNLSDPVENWALKFEINVPESWLGGSLMVATSTGNYLARYEPWQGLAAGFKTTGWQTVTIPFAQFRGGGSGKGEMVKTISDLAGSNGISSCQIYLHNYGTAPVAFKAAFDNIRVVKIIDKSIK